MLEVALCPTTSESTEAGVMIANLKGRLSREASDPSEVAAFCERLKGLTLLSYKSNLGSEDRTPLPAGFRNIRIIDARDQECIGTVWWIGESDVPNRHGLGFRVVTKRPDAQTIITIMLCMPFEEIVEWRSTIAVPSTVGTLELVVDITTKPRTLLPYDGRPLPADLAEWHSSRAPAKARRHDID